MTMDNRTRKSFHNIIKATVKVTEELKANGGILCEKSIALLEDGIKAGFLSLDENIRTRLDSVSDPAYY